MLKYFSSFLKSIDSLLAWLSTLLKQTTESYCDLETADSQYDLAGRDGSLVSIIEVQGITTLVGEEEFEYLHAQLTQTLRTILSKTGHTFQAVFHYDPEAVTEQVEKLLAPSRKTLESLHLLALNDLLDERKTYLSQYCAAESVYFVLWTHPHQLNKAEGKQAEKEKLQLIRTHQLPPTQLTQNVIASIPALRKTHRAAVNTLLHQLHTLQIRARLLKTHEAVYHMRLLADPFFTDLNWQASLPGDKIPLKLYQKNTAHVVDLLWPSLARQLLPRDAETIDFRTVAFGDRLYSCIFVDLLPKEIQPFLNFLKNHLTSRTPWRMAFLAKSDALHTVRFSATLAKFLSFASKENRLLSDAYDSLENLSLAHDEAIVQLKITACTWAPLNQINLLRTRAAELARAIQQWGASDVSEVSGDPFSGLISTLVGVSSSSVATPTLLPCAQMTCLLPIVRPHSLWEQGSQLFRTLDGKIWPFQLGSTKQASWIDLIYARPGSGKSVLSNVLNLSLCLKGGLKTLPYIAIIDIGPSSKGLVSLLQDALPIQQRHYVGYHKLQMDKNHCINPFDTQLGTRYPGTQERSFLINFLTLLATPLDKEEAYDGITDMAGAVIDELYKQFSDKEKPHFYTKHIAPSVDHILEKLTVTLDTRTTWWEITDLLFTHHYLKEAKLAQRYAMPLLKDVLSICRVSVITDLYGSMTTDTGENLIHAFSRMLSRSIREYPILSDVTYFDVQDAKIIVLDLDEVAKSGGPAADRQTAVMYMLARYLLTHHYYLIEHATNAPSLYLNYHRKRLQHLQESTKRLVFDEFHRTARTKAVRQQIITDMREGRKFNVQIALLSQSLEDFDTMMIEFATAVYILNAGPTAAIKKSVQIFGLNNTAQKLLYQQVHGPTEKGTPFLAQFSTVEGLNTQLLTLTLGPIELWALNTAREDTLLRDKLYQKIGSSHARTVLAVLYPTGTARKVMEKRLLSLNQKNFSLLSAEMSENMIEQLAQEALDYFYQHMQSMQP